MQEIKRDECVRSLDQLMTTSCILAGFAFSGLISLPGMEEQLFQKITSYVRGDFDLGFYCSFYALFFSTICFLSTIMTILVYKVSNYLVPIKKLRNIHIVANMAFSLAIAALFASVIAFGMPSKIGIWLAGIIGFGTAACFVWENLVPQQKEKREQQVRSEKKPQDPASKDQVAQSSDDDIVQESEDEQNESSGEK